MAKAKNTIPQAAYADEFVYNGETLSPVEFVEKLESAFAEQEHWKGAYFWGGDNGNRNRRNWQDRKDSHVDTFEYDGHTYKYVVDISRSRHITYVNSNKFTMDGGGSIRAWKKVRDQIVAAHPDLFPDRIPAKTAETEATPAEEKPTPAKSIASLNVSDVNRSYMVGNTMLYDGSPAILMFDVSGRKDYQHDQLVVTGEYSLVSAECVADKKIDCCDSGLYRCEGTMPAAFAALGDYPLYGENSDSEPCVFRRKDVQGHVEDQIDFVEYLDDHSAGAAALGVADELVTDRWLFDASTFKVDQYGRAESPALSDMLDTLDKGFIRVSDQGRSLDHDEYWRIEDAKTNAIDWDLDAQRQLESRVER